MQTKIKFLKRTVLLLAAVICLSAHTAVHPFYLSVTELTIDSHKKTVKISCRPFLDDLQVCLQQELRQNIRLTDQSPQNKKLVADYLIKHLQVFVGKKQLQLQSLGYEIEEEALWCYLEAKLPSTDKLIRVENSVLCESLSGQINIVHCLYDENRQSLRMACPEHEARFQY